MLPGDAALVPICTGTLLRGHCGSEETPADGKCYTNPNLQRAGAHRVISQGVCVCVGA